MHNYLIGSQVKKGWRIFGTVASVIVAPFDGINQHRFLKEYRRSRNEAAALQFYAGTLFTVLLVVAPVVSRQDIYTIELDRYLASIEHPENAFAFSL